MFQPLRFCSAVVAFLLTTSSLLLAQIGFNSPAGITPRVDFEAYTNNGFLVQQKHQYTAANPATNLFTISCTASPPDITSTAGTLLDPGGGGNYSPSLNCGQRINISATAPTAIGIELNFQSFSLDSFGDAVVIGGSATDSQSLTYTGSTLPKTIYWPDRFVYVRFVSDSDAEIGPGFALQWRALLPITSSTQAYPAFGRALFFDAQKGALLGGLIDPYNLRVAGNYSTALGYYNNANAFGAVALGDFNEASGQKSVALGTGNTANGLTSVAIGNSNRASEYTSVAIGYLNNVSGQFSTALGRSNVVSGDFAGGIGYNADATANYAYAFGQGVTASGEYSSALGNYMSTGGQKGAFSIGDSDPLFQGTTTSSVTDQFVARFLNGYYLLTSGNTSPGAGFGAVRTGVWIQRGQNSWAAISDSTKKERRLPIDESALLHKIKTLKLETWNYKGQREIRHYGPMAQDFYAAFGHDGLGQIGCDTLLYSHDFTGVAFAGVQALARENDRLSARTQQLRAESNKLSSLLVALQAQNAALQEQVGSADRRLSALENLLLNKRERIGSAGRSIATGQSGRTR